MLKLLNNQIHLINSIFVDKIKQKYGDSLSNIFATVLILNIASYFINSIFVDFLIIYLLFILIFSNKLINIFFSILIFVKYTIPLFLDYNNFSHTNESPQFINNFIFFSSISIILLFNANLIFKQTLNKNKIRYSFNSKFLKIITFITIINLFLIFYFLNDIRNLPIFWQIYNKSFYFFIIPLVMNGMSKNINLEDLLIVILSTINVLLLIFSQGYSRSLLVILSLIYIFFILRNPFQVIIFSALLICFYPLFDLIRGFNSNFSFYSLYLIISSFDQYNFVCNLQNDLGLFQPQYVLWLNTQNVHLEKCEMFSYLLNMNFQNFPSYLVHIFVSFIERLFNIFEFSNILLNKNYFTENYYYNNFFAVIPSIIYDKPNFYFYQGYDLFNLQLKPITDKVSTASLSIIPESISILRSLFILPFLFLAITMTVVNSILEKFNDINFNIGFSIFFLSIFFFKDTLTTISIDLVFILMVLIFYKFTKKYFIKIHIEKLCYKEKLT